MNKQTFWESEVYTLREQIQLIETERNNLERENAALRERLQMIADAYALDANELRDIARAVTSKQTGDDAIMRQHLTEGGTPT